MGMNRNAIIFFSDSGGCFGSTSTANPSQFLLSQNHCVPFFMHNIFSTTGVTSNQGKQLVKSGRLGSKDKLHNGLQESVMGRTG